MNELIFPEKFEDESVKLYLGDSLDIMKKFPSNSFQAIITDPPYSTGLSSNRRSANKPMGWGDINNASFWFAEWYKEAWRLLDNSGSLWNFASWKTLPILQCACSKIGGMYITSVIVWDKDWIGVGSIKGVRESYEMLVLFGKPDFRIEDRTINNIWKIPWASKKPNGHPSEKPEAVIDRILEVGDIKGHVLDPFIGSGTTAISCLKKDLEISGIDIERNWIETTQRRVRNYLASKAQFQLFGEGGHE